MDNENTTPGQPSDETPEVAEQEATGNDQASTPTTGDAVEAAPSNDIADDGTDLPDDEVEGVAFVDYDTARKRGDYEYTYEQTASGGHRVTRRTISRTTTSHTTSEEIDETVTEDLPLPASFAPNASDSYPAPVG